MHDGIVDIIDVYFYRNSYMLKSMNPKAQLSASLLMPEPEGMIDGQIR